LSVTRLTLADIADSRAYERERESFRAAVIALKKVRRVGIGPFVTVVFENATTMRFQVQEMARAEKMATDSQIQVELDIYNELIPGNDEISATLFIELTNEADLRLWLPKLVGVELAIELRLGSGVVKALVDEAHAAQLRRDEVTASVHYVKFKLSPDEASEFRADGAKIAVAHPQYAHSARLSAETVASIVADWV
jgi:hypothetical protein